MIDVTADQRWQSLQMHSIDFNRYGRLSKGRERLQAEIEAGSDNIILVYSP